MGIELTRAGILIDGRLVPFISGAFQYWRSPAESWEKIFDQLAELGLEFVETYIPWSVHELEKDKFDFGEKSPEKNLPRFLTLAQERGFKIFLRPGPHINAELTYWGYPRRLLEQKECLARSADGGLVWLPVPPKMFPLPSYASEVFFKEVRIWYQAVGKILKPFLYPQGPVVMIQVDNELCNFFRTSPYDYDYHPDAIRLWHKFLHQKFSDISRLNLAFGSNYSDFDQVEPARRFSAQSKKELVYFLSWVEFREYYLVQALARLKKMLEETGIKGVLFVSNYPGAGDFPPNNYTEREKILDFQGADIYPTRREYQGIKRLARFASGLSRFPCLPEFSSGAFLIPSISLKDQKFTTPSLFMHGVKGVNFYMMVERERWYGSPITRKGKKRKEYFEFFKKFIQLVKTSEVFKLEKYAPCLVLSNRDYERLESATTILEPLPLPNPELTPPELHCDENDFGFEHPIQLYARNFQEAIYRALDLAGFGIDLGNTAQPLNSLKKYPLVALSCFEFMSREVQEKLRAYAEQGGFLLLGPKLPELDENMEPCEILKEGLELKKEYPPPFPAKLFLLAKGKILLIPHNFSFKDRRRPPEELVEFIKEILLELGIERRFYSTTPKVESQLFLTDKRKILFVANPSGEAVAGKLSLPAPMVLEDLESSERFSGDSEVEIPLQAWQVRILEVKDAG